VISESDRREFLRVCLLENPDLEGWIIGNAHTVVGRFEVSFPEFRMSLSSWEVGPLTEHARWWLEGFLDGSEPDPESVLGPDFDPHEPINSANYQQYQEWIDAFHADGHWHGPQPWSHLDDDDS
jgi:hypothetical protein